MIVESSIPVCRLKIGVIDWLFVIFVRGGCALAILYFGLTVLPDADSGKFAVSIFGYNFFADFALLFSVILAAAISIPVLAHLCSVTLANAFTQKKVGILIGLMSIIGLFAITALSVLTTEFSIDVSVAEARQNEIESSQEYQISMAKEKAQLTALKNSNTVFAELAGRKENYGVLQAQVITASAPLSEGMNAESNRREIIQDSGRGTGAGVILSDTSRIALIMSLILFVLEFVAFLYVLDKSVYVNTLNKKLRANPDYLSSGEATDPDEDFHLRKGVVIDIATYSTGRSKEVVNSNPGQIMVSKESDTRIVDEAEVATKTPNKENGNVEPFTIHRRTASGSTTPVNSEEAA